MHFIARARERKPETVRVRIAVAVDPDGDWHSCGSRGVEEADAKSFAYEGTEQFPIISWIEADIPIPKPQTIEGEVVE